MSQDWEITEQEYGTTLTILRDWDLDIANQFLGCIGKNLDPDKAKNFIFDLHLAHHIDSMVIGIIISISKRVKKGGGRVAMLMPSPIVEKLLSDIGLLSYFEVFNSKEEMIKSLTEDT